MLSKPKYRWTDFKPGEADAYGLNYTDDIAFEWLDECSANEEMADEKSGIAYTKIFSCVKIL